MEIKVEKQAWDGISAEDREKIQQILREAGSIGPTDTVVGDAQQDGLFSVQNLKAGDGPCQAACSGAYARATRVCSLLPHPGARAVCYAAAMGAYAVCLRNC